jgi:hypothetical protein
MEIDSYGTFARPEMIKQYKSGRMLNHLGLLQYMASGSLVYRKEKSSSL